MHCQKATKKLVEPILAIQIHRLHRKRKKSEIGGNHVRPLVGIDGDGARLLQVVADEHLAHAAVEVGHLDRVAHRIGPVQVVVDPVHGQAVRVDHVTLEHQLRGQRDRFVRSNASAANRRAAFADSVDGAVMRLKPRH